MGLITRIASACHHITVARFLQGIRNSHPLPPRNYQNHVFQQVYHHHQQQRLHSHPNAQFYANLLNPSSWCLVILIPTLQCARLWSSHRKWLTWTGWNIAACDQGIWQATPVEQREWSWFRAPVSVPESSWEVHPSLTGESIRDWFKTFVSPWVSAQVSVLGIELHPPGLVTRSDLLSFTGENTFTERRAAGVIRFCSGLAWFQNKNSNLVVLAVLLSVLSEFELLTVSHLHFVCHLTVLPTPHFASYQLAVFLLILVENGSILTSPTDLSPAEFPVWLAK